MQRLLFSLFLLLHVSSYNAQDIAIGEWKEHLSYKAAISVAEGDGKVYCATRSGVFFYNKADNSMDRFSKVNGLSDVDPSVLNFNKADNKLLIAYQNSNIDLVEAGYITNISDIKRKQIVGNKTINNIHFINQFAYLACGFGIVVVDMDKVEVKDTYYIGPNGAYINVYDITSDGTYIYAATSGGIYKASLSSANLANYANWSKMTGLPNGHFNAIAAINGKIVANFSKSLTSGTAGQDTIFYYNNTSWSHMGVVGNYTVKGIKTQGNGITVTYDGSVSVFDINLSGIANYNSYSFGSCKANAAVYDAQNSLWIADEKYGLVSKIGSSFAYKYPNGPAGTSIYGMSVKDGNIMVAPGGKLTYVRDGLYWNTEGEWKNLKGNYPGVVNLDTISDIINVLIDPLNAKRAFMASWGQGLIELYNGVPVNYYVEANSSLQGLGIPNYNPIRVYGMAVDDLSTLWVANQGASEAISSRTASGSWKSLNFSAYFNTGADIGELLIDKNSQKWLVIGGLSGGLMVYKGGTNDIPSNANTKKFSTAAGNGALPSLGVYSIAEDLDGEIWIGTDKGVAVFYSPENIFSGQNFDAQQILIEQDGNVQILLETEQVQAIAVDDANRKWIGTASSGVYLISADGTEQLFHFTESNSPLFSDNVKHIKIDRATGEIYFGTSKGLISYRGTAIEGNENFKDVYAFPNPVKPEYGGPIAIKGLINNSIIKITDISGSLVFETKSEGGQAIWYGKNFNGEKVSTGVYMVFCTSEDGSQKIATKILFIN